MIDFTGLIFDKVIECIVSEMKNEFISNEDPLYQQLLDDSSIHQKMIEDIYISSIKSYFDYLHVGKYDKAADCLMDLSNRPATPIVKYLLGRTLLRNGEKKLAYNKIAEAIAANPLLIISNELSFGSVFKFPEINASWEIKPCSLDDNLLYKILRFNFEISEGLESMSVSTFGGHIAYSAKYINNSSYKCKYGLLNIENGQHIWLNNDKQGSREIVLSTPKYIIYEKNDKFEIFESKKGQHVASYTKGAFYLFFCPQKLLESDILSKYQTNLFLESIDYEPDPIELRTFSDSKLIKVRPFTEKVHRLLKSEGEYPYRTPIWDYYDANNVWLSLIDLPN